MWADVMAVGKLKDAVSVRGSAGALPQLMSLRQRGTVKGRVPSV